MVDWLQKIGPSREQHGPRHWERASARGRVGQLLGVLDFETPSPRDRIPCIRNMRVAHSTPASALPPTMKPHKVQGAPTGARVENNAVSTWAEKLTLEGPPRPTG